MPYSEPHDEFAELCALSTSGQLSEEERKKFEAHLLICSECREAIRQYEAIIEQAIPAFIASEAPDDIPPGPAWSQDCAEKALFDRIAEESRGVAGEPGQPAGRMQTPLPFAGQSTWNQLWMLGVSGALLAVALGICIYQVGTKRGLEQAKASSIFLTPTSPASTIAAVVPQSQDRSEREKRESEVAAELRKQLASAVATTRQMQAEYQRLSASLGAEITAKEDLAKREAVGLENFETARRNSELLQQELEAARRELANSRTQDSQSASQMEELTKRLRQQNSELEQKDELLAKDRDIRELMGARDLYVAEVYDVAGTGKTRKSYGRVFYTKGKSLIFYAYDLDENAKIKNVNTFQAWGRRGPDRQQALNLGIFFEDNSSKKRWILKLNDPRTLDQIDAVFVTVEPHGGSDKPSGKPLLFAYLKADPNHP